jgi:hypothetical protein
MWKSNKVLVSIVVVVVVITAIGGLIQAVYGIANLYKDIIFSNNNEAYDLSINEPVLENKCFLVFPNRYFFENWHKEVMFRLGLPKHPRNFITEELQDDSLIKNYANGVKHPNPQDKRIRCGYDEQIPKDLIDDNAAKKYQFIKATYKDVEDMGFINDSPEISKESAFNFSVSEIKEFTSYIQPITNRTWMFSPEYNIGFVMIIYDQVDKRNKYLFDLGSKDNKSRLSIYIDRENNLCFRVIDGKSNSYVLRLFHNLFGKLYQYNFKFASYHDEAYMEIYINGNIVAKKSFENKIPFKYYQSNKVFTGANLKGTYCAKMQYYLADAHIIENEKKLSLFQFDFHKTDNMYFCNGEIVYYRNGKEKIDFNRR